jgi:hypothetical protein
MLTFKDYAGVIHVVTRRFPEWTCCNVRMTGEIVDSPFRFPTCLRCAVSKLWDPWR